MVDVGLSTIEREFVTAREALMTEEGLPYGWISDVARQVGVARSTAHRLNQSLQVLGVIEPTPAVEARPSIAEVKEWRVRWMKVLAAKMVKKELIGRGLLQPQLSIDGEPCIINLTDDELDEVLGDTIGGTRMQPHALARREARRAR
jgi:hypothetical protein